MYQLISADSHVNEPPELWSDRVPAKLRDRALRLVCELRGCSRDEARQRLEAAGGSVRAALEERG